MDREQRPGHGCRIRLIRTALLALLISTALPLEAKGTRRSLADLVREMQSEILTLRETVAHQNQRLAELEKPSPKNGRSPKESGPSSLGSPPVSARLLSTHKISQPTLAAEVPKVPDAVRGTHLDSEQALLEAHEQDKIQNPGDVFKTEPEPGRLGEPARDPLETTLNFYGFVQLDTIYDADPMDPAWQATLRPSKIPVDCALVRPIQPGCGTNAASILSAKQTRFGLKTLTPTRLGEVKTTFEFDLFGVGANAGQTTFRLRHAYAEFDSLLFGQTWSNFMDVDVWPNIIDYWGPPGMIFQRQPQLRWTPIHTPEMTVAAALESPNAAIDSGKVTETYPSAHITPRTPYPDLTSRIRVDRDWGHLQLANVLRAVGYQNIGNWQGEPTGVYFGWGFNLSGAFKTWQKDQFLASIAYGKGVASYFEDGGVDGAPQANLNQGELLPLFGVLAYYDHYWSDQWSSSVGYSQTLQPNDVSQRPNAFHLGQYASANLLYAPIPKFLTGLEILWGRLEDYRGGTGDDRRIQFSARYNYDISFRPGF